MKERKDKIRVPILAAGGIVLRSDDEVRIAVVQSRKLSTWGLPKGKLAAGEDAVTAARREVLEETGHHVTVHEFLGTLVYETSSSSRAKAVQFWRMEAAGAPAGTLMRDIMAVDWLALDDAINRLSHMREQVFLEQVGPIALKLAARSATDAPLQGNDAGRILARGVPLAPADDASLSEAETAGGEVPCPIDRPALPKRVAEKRVAAERSEWSLSELSLGGKILMKKTWGWFRHAATLHRLPID